MLADELGLGHRAGEVRGGVDREAELRAVLRAEAVGVALRPPGLVEQGRREVGVVGEELREVGGLGNRGLQPARRGFPRVGEDGSQDLRPVDPAGEGLAHADVVERGDVGAEAVAVHEPEVAGDLDVEAGVGEGLQQLRVHVVGQVGLVGAGRGGAQGVVGEHPEGDRLEQRRAARPEHRGRPVVVLAAHEPDVVTGGPRVQHEGARTDLEGEIGLLLEGPGQARRSQEQAPVVPEGRQEGEGRGGEVDLHRQLVHGLGRREGAAGEQAHGREPLVGAADGPGLDVGDDRLGVQRRPVREGDAAAQVQHVGRRVLVLLPGFGDPGGDRPLGVRVHELVRELLPHVRLIARDGALGGHPAAVEIGDEEAQLVLVGARARSRGVDGAADEGQGGQTQGARAEPLQEAAPAREGHRRASGEVRAAASRSTPARRSASSRWLMPIRRRP